MKELDLQVKEKRNDMPSDTSLKTNEKYFSERGATNRF